ncbi:MAG: hypothetical protein JWM44_2496 [Bacilli bacterium]|nr:hypothetical protein [Bacilli bacterium]
MEYAIEDGFVYRSYKTDHGSSIKQMIGGTSKTETIRIDSNTVTDISYQFDIDLGMYTELSRANRTDVDTTPLPETIESLKVKMTQMSEENQAFMDFYFAANPE